MIDTTLSVILDRRLVSLTREMGYIMLRSTRSPILNQARDFVTGIFGPEGEQLAQTEYIPIISCMWPALKETIRFFGEEIYDGDLFIFNDTFSGGNQLADVMIYKPVFDGGRRIGWTAVKGHVADIGGAVAGGYNPAANEVWQEGLRIPPLKIVERGTEKKDVWRFLFSNVRQEIVPYDVRAAMSTCRFGEERYKKFVKDHGFEKFWSLVTGSLESTEKRVRSLIEKIPEGTYKGGSHTTDVFDNAKKHLIKVQVLVKNRHLSFDFAGSAKQTNSFGNGTWATTYSATLVALYYLLDPDIPHNQGVLKCFDIDVPEGSILNAKFPAATTFGNQVCGDNVPIAIFRALSRVMQNRLCAEWCRWYGPIITGTDPRTHSNFVDISFFAGKGGSGASYGCDGWDHLGLLRNAGGVASQDIEYLETADPILVEANELVPDSAGNGEWRGGLGVLSKWTSYATNARLVVYGETLSPTGLHGGVSPEMKSFGKIVSPSGKVTKTADFGIYPIEQGSKIIWFVTGGGGFGDAKKRDPKLVARDLRDEKISPKIAKKYYSPALRKLKK